MIEARRRLNTLIPAVIVTAVVAAQLLIPLKALDQPRPARFGWHMYAARKPVAEYTAIDEEGNRQRIKHLDYAASKRVEVDFPKHMPSFLCNRLPGAQQILIRHTRPKRTEVFRCPSS